MKRIKLTAARLNIRKSPSMTSEVLKIVNRGDIIEYTSVKNGWVRSKGAGDVMEEFVNVIEKEKSPKGDLRTRWIGRRISILLSSRL